MPRANNLNVNIVGHDKGFGKAMKGAARDASTLHGKFKLLGASLKNLLTGNLKGAAKELKTLAGGFGKMGGLALGGIGVAITALTGLIGFIHSATQTWADYMGKVGAVKRLTGLTAVESSKLVGQFRLTGTDIEAAGAGLKFFAKNLDAARQGTKAQADAFKRLGVSLKDSNGQWRAGSDVLADVRNNISKLKDPVARTALTLKVFGRGGTEMLRWLTASPAKMREYAKFVHDLGLEMGEKSLRTFNQYRENQRKLGLAWDAIKIGAAGAFAPLINRMMPTIIRLFKTVAGWANRFRELIEQKGWGGAIQQMCPWIVKVKEAGLKVWEVFKKVWGVVETLAGKFKSAWDQCRPLRDALLAFDKITFGALLGALGKVLDTLGWIIDKAQTAWRWLKDVFGAGGSGNPNAGGQRGGGTPTPTGSRPAHGRGALGGIYDRATDLLIGEDGPEALIPLTKPRRAAEVMGAAGIGGPTINFYGDVVGVDATDLANKVVNILTVRSRRVARGMA